MLSKFGQDNAVDIENGDDNDKNDNKKKPLLIDNEKPVVDVAEDPKEQQQVQKQGCNAKSMPAAAVAVVSPTAPTREPVVESENVAQENEKVMINTAFSNDNKDSSFVPTSSNSKTIENSSKSIATAAAGPAAASSSSLSSSTKNNDIVDDTQDVLELSAGTRLEVQWQIDVKTNDTDDDHDDDEPQTRWRGATLVERMVEQPMMATAARPFESCYMTPIQKPVLRSNREKMSFSRTAVSSPSVNSEASGSLCGQLV